MSNFRIVQVPKNDWTIKRVIENGIPRGWEKVFEDSREGLDQISDNIEKDEKQYGRVVPDKCNIFAAFDSTPLNKIKVVLIGQDPYPTILNDGKPRATGKSFSVRRNDEIPKSLINIFKEIQRTHEDFQMPNHGCLDAWCRQGVLLLNSSLTFSPKRAELQLKNHFNYDFWTMFVKNVLTAIEENCNKPIFMLWGREAEKMQKFLSEKSIKLITSHPSPLSVSRGFDGCGHFKQVNDILTAQGKEIIDWNLD